MPLAHLYRDVIGRTDSRTSRRDASIPLLNICPSTTCIGKISGHRFPMQVEKSTSSRQQIDFALPRKTPSPRKRFDVNWRCLSFSPVVPSFPLASAVHDKPRARFEMEGSAHRSALELIINEFLRCNSHELGPVGLPKSAAMGKTRKHTTTSLLRSIV